MAQSHYLLERDALNGKEGSAFVTRRDPNTGVEETFELFRIKNLTVDAEFQTVPFKVVGTRIEQKKITGLAFTGSMVIYYGTPEWIKIVQDYVDYGFLPVVTLKLVNRDPSTTVGGQSVILNNVKIEKIPLVKMDAEADWLEMDVSFSFTDFAVEEYFQQPDTLGVSKTVYIP